MKLNQKILNTILEGMNFNIDNSLENDIKLSKQDSMSKISTNIAKLFKEKYYDKFLSTLLLISIALKTFKTAIKDDITLIMPLYKNLHNLVILITLENIDEDSINEIIAINTNIFEIYGLDAFINMEIINTSNDKMQNLYEYHILNKNFEKCLDIYKKYNTKYKVNNDTLKIIIDKTYLIGKYDINLNWLDTSNVTSMENLFMDYNFFNGDISEWDTSNVQNMRNMFYLASSFNGFIGKWDVSNVANMNTMFFGAENFNLNISEWNTKKVKDMSFMFDGAKAFNLPINSWNVSNVTNMEYMFYNAVMFNLTLSKWSVSKVTNMDHMFDGAKAFKQNISMWNVEKCTSYFAAFERGVCPLNFRPKFKSIF